MFHTSFHLPVGGLVKHFPLRPPSPETSPRLPLRRSQNSRAQRRRAATDCATQEDDRRPLLSGRFVSSPLRCPKGAGSDVLNLRRISAIPERFSLAAWPTSRTPSDVILEALLGATQCLGTYRPIVVPLSGRPRSTFATTLHSCHAWRGKKETAENCSPLSFRVLVLSSLQW